MLSRKKRKERKLGESPLWKREKSVGAVEGRNDGEKASARERRFCIFSTRLSRFPLSSPSFLLLSSLLVLLPPDFSSFSPSRISLERSGSLLSSYNSVSSCLALMLKEKRKKKLSLASFRKTRPRHVSSGVCTVKVLNAY